VADFGTSRFLEIAAHGTTVIGSPPYMAPEQFHGKAVFASDIYSVGVTMYEMLTGALPYQTPSPADLEKLMRGELVAPPRLKNASIPRELNDIIMRAMAPDVGGRYQRAGELLEDLLAARSHWVGPRGRRRAPLAVAPRPTAGGSETGEEHDGRKGHEASVSRFCWHCRKPLHARANRCPFCGELQ
jgi:serine/threonine protein kinase